MEMDGANKSDSSLTVPPLPRVAIFLSFAYKANQCDLPFGWVSHIHVSNVHREDSPPQLTVAPFHTLGCHSIHKNSPHYVILPDKVDKKVTQLWNQAAET